MDYQKKNLPILIINEHGNWREIRDMDGDETWMHISMISNKKTFINNKEQNLLKYKDNSNIVKAIVKRGVVGKILSCDEIFCKLKVKTYKGWVKKKYLWGIKKNKLFVFKLIVISILSIFVPFGGFGNLLILILS